MEITFTLIKKTTVVIALCLLYQGGMITASYAQTSYITPAELKAKTKKSKKESASFEAEHKESHLNVADISYKVGWPGRKAIPVEEESTEYNSDKEINALYYSPKQKEKKKLFKKRSKAEKAKA